PAAPAAAFCPWAGGWLAPPWPPPVPWPPVVPPFLPSSPLPPPWEPLGPGVGWCGEGEEPPEDGVGVGPGLCLPEPPPCGEASGDGVPPPCPSSPASPCEP